MWQEILHVCAQEPKHDFFIEFPAIFSKPGNTEGVHELSGKPVSASKQAEGTKNVGKPSKVLKASKRGGVRSRINRKKNKL